MGWGWGGPMPPSHDNRKIDFWPPKYILLGSCTGPLGKFSLHTGVLMI